MVFASNIDYWKGESWVLHSTLQRGSIRRPHRSSSPAPPLCSGTTWPSSTHPGDEHRDGCRVPHLPDDGRPARIQYGQFRCWRDIGVGAVIALQEVTDIVADIGEVTCGAFPTLRRSGVVRHRRLGGLWRLCQSGRSEHHGKCVSRAGAWGGFISGGA